MTRVSREAGELIENLVTNPNVPPALKTRILNRLSTPTAAEQNIRANIIIFANPTNTIPQRLAALDIIIDYYLGIRT